jgi:hypothetical protein
MVTKKSAKKAPADPSKRQLLSKITRDKATRHQTATGNNQHQPRYDVPYGLTPDEENAHFRNYAASFHKLLEHDTTTGLLTNTGPTNGVESYKNLLKGLKIKTPNSDFDQDALNDINLAPSGELRPRVIINPQSSKALTIKGGDSAAYRFRYKEPTHREWEVGYEVVYAQGEADNDRLLDELSFSSPYSAAEMIEVYAMALLRDLNFDVYGIPHPDVQLAIEALNTFENYFRGPKESQGGGYRVTPKTLFRGNSPESLRGDYLSKYLLLRRPPLFASGCAPGTANISNAQIFFCELAESFTVPQPNPLREFGVTWDDYVAIQNGKIPLKYQPGDFLGKALVSNGRNLGSLVHVDSLYQEYAWAVDILTGGDYRRTPVSPYMSVPPYAKNEGDGPTLGPPDASGLVGAVALEAARVAWTQKYLVARRGRPEVFAALLHKRLEHLDENNYGPLDERLLNEDGPVRELLNRVRQVNAARGGDTYLLSQMFPEASPAHPAWTSGHATVAGACVTVIKAIFDDIKPLLQQVDCNPSPVCPNANNDPPVPPPPFTDEDGQPLTVGGELDKLASNVALGRNFGGVHFRSDGEHGILLGEEVAIRFLQDHLRTYREKFRCDDSHQGTAPCFRLTKRSGERVMITATAITPVAVSEAAAKLTAETATTAEVTVDRSFM